MTDVLAPPMTLLDRARIERANDVAAKAAEDARYHAQQEAANLSRLFKTVRDYFGLDGEALPLTHAQVEQHGGGESWVGEYPVVTIEGLRFTLAISYQTDLGLIRECPKCHTLLSEPVYSLAHLADVHDGPVSHYRCPAHEGKTVPAPVPIAPTVEQRVLSALKDLIAQEVPNGES